MSLHQTWGRMNELASAIVMCFLACFWMCLAVQDVVTSNFQFKSQCQLPLMTWQHIWFSRLLSEWPQTQHNHCQHAACDQLEQHHAEETTRTAAQHTFSSIKPSDAEKESDTEADNHLCPATEEPIFVLSRVWFGWYDFWWSYYTVRYTCHCSSLKTRSRRQKTNTANLPRRVI